LGLPEGWREDWEEEAIRAFLSCCPSGGGAGEDDAAVLPGGLVLNVDAMNRSRHVPRELREEDLGWKFVTAVVSDVAAMGGRPEWFALSVVLDDRVDVERLAEGVGEALREYGAVLVGGDVSRGEELCMSGVCLGRVVGRVLRARDARPGDAVGVSGPLGGPNAFVRCVLEGVDPPEGAYEAFARPVARVDLGVELSASGERVAVTDVSDGLVADAGWLARVSGVRIVVEGDSVPVHPAAVEAGEVLGVDPLELALEGGEEFELLVCGPRGVLEGFGFEIVGRVEEGRGVKVV